ncbi:MAG: polyketide cyclase [Myxococcaceae bacterium]|nr:polyketide cyclase [Myxococcaceae bacterium]
MITDPKLDLILERSVDVSPELVWMAWTQPERLKRWFTPKPWTTVECEIDLRPGGLFRTVMRSPEGELFPNVGCFLEIVPNRKLVWTDALEAEFRPARQEPGANCPFHFTATILLEARGSGTKYTAIVLHKDEASRKKHEEMGFQTGWGTALDQLVEDAKASR